MMKYLYKKRQKISVNMNQDLVALADKIGTLTGKTRTDVITAFVFSGIKPFLEDMEKTWLSYLKFGNTKSEKRQNLKALIIKLKKTKKDWRETTSQWEKCL